MRSLTSKQKKLIKKWVDDSKHTIRSVDDFSIEQWNILEEINDTEILWQEANRFISDLGVGGL